MRRFEQREIREAQDYAAAGGQALHIWAGSEEWPGAPQVFRREAAAGRPWAHLFDQDTARLIATAKACGVHVVAIGRRGQRGQHVDLCGRPLQLAIERCEQAQAELSLAPPAEGGAR